MSPESDNFLRKDFNKFCKLYDVIMCWAIET